MVTDRVTYADGRPFVLSRRSFLAAPIYLNVFRQVINDMRLRGEFARIMEAFYQGYSVPTR